MKFTATREIDVPVDKVFQFVSNIPEMAKAFPDQVVKLELLSENETGIGARYREYRMLGKKEDVIEIETKEYVENERVESETTTHGSVWRTGFAVEPDESGTLLTLTMEAEPQNLLARIMNAFMKSGLQKGAATEADKVKEHLERAFGASG